MLNMKEDLLFWTSVMRDHANFQVNAFAPKEKEFIEKSQYFMGLFEEIYNEIKAKDSIKDLYPKLIHALRCFIDYKRSILKNQLICSVAVNLPPTIISHQINEANQFMMYLTTPAPKHMDQNMNAALFIELLKQWASDAAGHAAALASFLDAIEGMYIEKAMLFKKHFEMLMIKAMELQVMLVYTGLEDGVLSQLGQETIEELTDFNAFLKNIKELREECRIVAQGTFTPLVPDHFMREHDYWIMKIKEFMR